VATAPQRPQFCPWCGSPSAYDEHEHEPRYELLTAEARARGEDPPPLPERVRDALAGESYAGVCPGCRMISHVVGHRAQG
jgi:hypothetical protein